MEKTDVLIIGGGIIGAAAAYFLSRDGVDVLLVEKGELGREASGATAGTLSIQNKEEKSLALAREGVRIWAELQDEIGEPLEFVRTGGLRVAETEDQVRTLEKAARRQRKSGLTVDIWDHTRLRKEAAYLSPDIAAASFCPLDSRCNPLKAVVALAEHASRQGARFRLGEAVEAIASTTADGFLVTTSRQCYHGTMVLNCTGVWSRQIFRLLGLDLPVVLSPQQVMVTEQVPPLFSHVISHIQGKLTLKQVESGNVVIGGGWEGHGDTARGLKDLEIESLMGNIRYAGRVIPGLNELYLLRCWIGFEGRTPDRLPLLGSLRSHPQFLTAGCAKGGFTMGPLLAKLAAEFIRTGKTSIPLDDFDANRFFSG